MAKRRTAEENYRWTDDFADVFPETGELNYALIDIQGIIRYHSPGLGELTSARHLTLEGTRADSLFVQFSLPKTSSGSGEMQIRNPNGCGRLRSFWKRIKAGFLFLFIDIEPFSMEKVPRGVLSVVQTQDLLHDLRTTLTTMQLAAYEMKPVNPYDEHQGERVQLLLRESWAQERIFTAVGAMTRFPRIRPIFKFNEYLHKIFTEFEFTLNTRGQSFTSDFPINFPTVHCDPKRLEQCLLQLICLACNDREARSLHAGVSLSEDGKQVEFELRVQPPRVHRPCAEQFSMAFVHQVADEHSGSVSILSDGYLMTIRTIPENYQPDESEYYEE